MSYLPTMKEGKSKFYLPLRSTIGGGLALAFLLVASIGGAMYYPTAKRNEAEQQLMRINAFTTEYLEKANAAISAVAMNLDAISDEDDRNGIKGLYSKKLAEYREQVAKIKPLDKAEILQVAQEQQRKYDEAQALIKASPFRFIDSGLVPPTEEGKAYLNARDVKAPPKFSYVQLNHAMRYAIEDMKTASRMLDGISNYQKTVVRRLFPEQAKAELAAEVAAQQAAAAKEKPQRFQFDGTQEPETQQRRMFQAAPKPQAAIEENPYEEISFSYGNTKKPAAPAASGLSPEAQLLAQMEAEEKRRIEAAEREERQAQLAAERKELQAQQAAERQQRLAQQAAERKKQEAARAEQQRQRQAQQAQQEAERQQRLAQQAAERQQQEAERAAAAKAKQCSASTAARLACVAQGYNPRTGYKIR